MFGAFDDEAEHAGFPRQQAEAVVQPVRIRSTDSTRVLTAASSIESRQGLATGRYRAPTRRSSDYFGDDLRSCPEYVLAVVNHQQ